MDIKLLMMIEGLIKDGQVIYSKKQFCKPKGEEYTSEKSVTRDINYTSEVIEI
jgi:hypothetical protein